MHRKIRRGAFATGWCHRVKNRVKKRALSAALVKPSQNVFTVHERRHVICDIWSVT